METKSSVSAAGAMVGLEGLLAELEMQSTAEKQGAEAEPLSGDADAPTVAPEEGAATTKPVKKPAGKKSTTKSASTGGKKGASKKKPDAPKVEPEQPKVDADAKTEPTPEPTVAAPQEDKPAPKERIYFGRNKVGRLEHKLGADLGKLLVLSVKDADLEGDAFAAKVEETKVLIKGLGQKVQNRASNLIEFVAGKKSSLNPVIETALRMLSKDGKLESGDKGNLHVKLLNKPYSPAAARAMGNNTLNMLKNLGVTVESGKQCFVPNGDSTLLALVSERLALSFVDNDAAIAELEKREAEERAAALKPEDNAESLAEPGATTGETADAPEASTAELGAMIDGLIAGAQAAELDALAAMV